MRALILAFSILAIVDSAHLANAGLSSTPRETFAPADSEITADEATEQTEQQIGLTKATRRKVQRGLTSLGFDTKVNGKFDKSTRAAIARWQEERGYPSTGFLDAAQHKVLTDAATEAGKSDHKDRRRAGGRTRNSRSVGGPIGVIGARRGARRRRRGGRTIPQVNRPARRDTGTAAWRRPTGASPPGRLRDRPQPFFTIGHMLSLSGRAARSAGTVASSLR
jgi:peptidoglycan hydrolase-like protein with peptidoglycan-binding domain